MVISTYMDQPLHSHYDKHYIIVRVCICVCMCIYVHIYDFSLIFT